MIELKLILTEESKEYKLPCESIEDARKIVKV